MEEVISYTETYQNKTFMKSVLFNNILCLLPIALWLMQPVRIRAQEVGKERHIFAAHTGVGLYTGNMLGIAGNTSGLRTGVTWAGSYTYLAGHTPVRGGFGVLYQGNRYSNKQPNSDDQITTHYLAPQLSIHSGGAKWHGAFTIGCGYQWYTNHSSVYGNPRKVTMNKVAGNIGASCEYRLARHWGISAQANYILAKSSSYSVNYHDRIWEVRPGYNFNGEKRVRDISQLSFSAGIQYHL